MSGSAPESRPNEGDRFWERFYDECAVMFGEDPFPFINLGFVDPEDADGGIDPEDPGIVERISERLYDRALSDVDLEGRVVLEVGCGRGGGCAHMARSRQPREVIGVDRSLALIELCAAGNSAPGLRFEQGEASRLPVPRESVDVVVNVESSHSYPSRLDFFEEVARALRPGGRFALADVLFAKTADRSPGAVGELLTEAGLEVLVAEDITDCVIRARDVMSESTAFRARLATALKDREAIDRYEEIFCMHGSQFYGALKDGTFAYWRWTARAPG